MYESEFLLDNKTIYHGAHANLGRDMSILELISIETNCKLNKSIASELKLHGLWRNIFSFTTTKCLQALWTA